MITKVSFKNFKSLRDVEIDLERFTMFVGPNASGKSSILQGLDYLCKVFQLPNGVMDARIHSLRSFGSEDAVTLTAKCDNKYYRYTPITPKPFLANFQNPDGWDVSGQAIATDLDREDWERWQFVDGNASPLPSPLLLRLEMSKLVESNHSSDPSLASPDGTGIHSALANMALNDPDSWQELQEKLRSIIPTIRRLRFTRSGNAQQASLLFDVRGADGLAANDVSEGALLVLGILATMYRPDQPGLILIDDLDRGLHPMAQVELIKLLRGFLEAKPGLQIVAATHSTYVLNAMEPEEVRILMLDGAGTTHCGALVNLPQFQRWKDEFHPGEMWSVFGEDWVIPAEAAAEPVTAS